MSGFWQIWIELWPVAVVVAFMALALIPERWQSGSHESLGVESVLVILAAGFWFVPAWIAYPLPDSGDDVGFWRQVWPLLGQSYHQLTSWWLLVDLSGYLAVGAVWAVVYFWLYANRLGQLYVQGRDAWLRENGWARLDEVPAERRGELVTVREAVQNAMIYLGDFPLRPLQQKRFFTANMMLWPLTMVGYFFGDFLLDVARSIWYALRDWLHAKWVVGMAQYIEDEALCQAKLAEWAEAKKKAKRDAPLSGGVKVYE